MRMAGKKRQTPLGHASIAASPGPSAEGSNVGRLDLHMLDALCERVIEICRRDGSTSIAAIRDELNTSRRYAQALLEHLDAEKLTVRRGDAHFLRRRATRRAPA